MLISTVWRVQIEGRADRHDAGGIYLIMRHVIVPLDVVEVHRRGYPVVLIQIAQVRPEVRVVDNAAKVAFEVAMLDRIESDQRREKAPVGFSHTLA